MQQLNCWKLTIIHQNNPYSIHDILACVGKSIYSKFNFWLVELPVRFVLVGIGGDARGIQHMSECEKSALPLVVTVVSLGSESDFSGCERCRQFLEQEDSYSKGDEMT